MKKVIEIDLLVTPYEIQKILGMGIMNIPKVFTYEMIEVSYKKTENERLKHILDTIEKDDCVEFKF